jgi:hypothetical protein
VVAWKKQKGLLFFSRLQKFSTQFCTRLAARVNPAAGQIFCGIKSEYFSQAQSVSADGQLVSAAVSPNGKLIVENSAW